MADDNSATSSSIEKVATIPIPKAKGDNTPSPIVLHGNQLVRKFNSVVPDVVHVLLAVFRIKSKNVDLVLSVNVPLGGVEDEADVAEYHRAQHDFDAAAKSLRILDFDLFV